MVKNEVYFRAVLIVSTLVLAGIVSVYILRSIDDIEEVGSDDLVIQLKKNFISASMLEPGSSTIIKIPDPPSGEHAIIKVTQGGISLKDSGKVSRILIDQRVTPSQPTFNVNILKSDIARRIGLISGGYSVRTPVELNISICNCVNSTIIFIQPVEIINDNRSELVCSFLEDIFIPEEGWRNEFLLEGEPQPIIDHSGLILIGSDQDIKTEGSCPIPIVLPLYARIMLEGDLETYQGPLLFARYSKPNGDGTFQEVLEITPQ